MIEFSLPFCKFVCKPALGSCLPYSKNGHIELETSACDRASTIADVAPPIILICHHPMIRKMIVVVMMRMRFHATRIQMFRKRVNALLGFTQPGLHELGNDGTFNCAQLFNHAGIMGLIHITMHNPFMGSAAGVMNNFGWYEMCNKSNIVQ